MAKKKSREPEEVNCEGDPSPMIDCCFLLLMFFIVNASQITVSKDPSVNMPHAVSASEMKDANGCIVVNVFADPDVMGAKNPKALEKFNQTYAAYPGTVWGVADASQNSIGYTSGQSQQLSEFITKQREAMEAKGIKPEMIRLYLRGDADAPWSRSSGAIRAAAAAGVSNIVFGSLPAEN
jgi:biopolymer transport protein ExbD